MKRTKRILLSTVFLTVALMAFSACGNSFDASLYVKGSLDAAFHGVYDEEFLQMLDDGTTKESLKEEATATIDEEINSILEGFSITEPAEGTKENLEKMFTDLFAATKYEVGEATESDKGYTVPVTIYPITTLQEVSDDENGALSDIVTQKYTADMTDEQLYEMILNEMVTMVETGLKAPTYDEAQRVSIKVYKNDDGYYTVDDDAMSNLGALLINS